MRSTKGRFDLPFSGFSGAFAGCGTPLVPQSPARCTVSRLRGPRGLSRFDGPFPVRWGISRFARPFPVAQLLDLCRLGFSIIAFSFCFLIVLVLLADAALWFPQSAFCLSDPPLQVLAVQIWALWGVSRFFWCVCRLRTPTFLPFAVLGAWHQPPFASPSYRLHCLATVHPIG